MVDLRHREPKRREPGLLLQHRGDVALHGRQLALGGADLVAAPGRHDDTGGVFRLRAKRRHVGGDPSQRPHEQVMQREIHQRRRDARDQQREHQDVDRVAQHRLP